MIKLTRIVLNPYLVYIKIVLDIPNSKAGFIMELLSSLSFVKTRLLPEGISEEKALFLAEFVKSVNELNQVLADQNPVRDAYQLLDEL